MLPFGWSILGLEEQISPLFGLTLLELVELISIISIVGVFLTGFFLYISTVKKSKTESANISIKMLEMSQAPKYQTVFEKLREKKTLEEQEIKDILRYYEYVAEFAKDNVITYDHILHIHGFNLKGLYNNKQVRKYFEDARKNRSNYTFINLYDLFLKIDDDL